VWGKEDVAKGGGVQTGVGAKEGTRDQRQEHSKEVK